MSDARSVETIEFECQEECRTARLMVEWERVDGERRLASVQCDNPRFNDIDNWECHWSCWQKVEEQLAKATAAATDTPAEPSTEP